MPCHIRPAVPADAPAIHALIVALATYEKEPDAVEVTVETLAAQLAADSPPFECLIAVERKSAAEHENAIGFALFFPSYSTWRGRPGLYLEDLFVIPERRGHGVGRALLQHLAEIAVTRDYARMEWSVLDWNVPAIDFYRALGARPMDEWTTYRLTGDALATLAGSAPAKRAVSDGDG
jgi:GNAT superfamily N-acetyltransferase